MVTREEKVKAGILITMAPWLLTVLTGWLAYEFRDFKGEVRELKDAIVQLRVTNSTYSTKIEAHESRLSRLESRLDAHVQEDIAYRAAK